MTKPRHPFEERDVDRLLETGGGLIGDLATTGEDLPHGLPDDVGRWIGRQFGSFELVDYLDRGGMSLVFRAERRGGDFEQTAAVKLLLAAGSAQLVRRFARERQILAHLDHPGIARIVDGGVQEGQPYLVMELVEGRPIDAYCDQQRMNLGQRIDLFIQVCEAVQFAHSRLVVHRDIKPGNILVSSDGTVKLLDFGIARLLEDDGGDLTTGTPLLTPRFASPEQVLGEPVNVASDIYQLGLLLHLLLTGTHAQPIEDASIAAIKEAVVDLEAVSPSQALENTGRRDRARAERIARARRLPVDRLQRRVRGDLDIIVGACLAKEPDQRYRSVQDLVRDLRAWREFRPIRARAPSRSYRLIRFARRHWGGVTTTVLTGIALLIACVAVLTSWRETLQARALAEREADTASAVSTFLADLLEQADPRRAGGEELTVVELLNQGAARLDKLSDQRAVQVQLLKTMAMSYFGLGEYPSVEALARQALELQDQGGVPDARVRSELLHSLASALAGQGRMDEAMAVAEQATELFEALGEDDAMARARALHTLAIRLFEKKELERAIVLEEQSLALLRQVPNTRRQQAVVLTTIGSAARMQGGLEVALDYYLKALALVCAGDPIESQKGAVFRGMAQSWYHQGDLVRAGQLAGAAVVIDRAVYGPDHDQYLRSLMLQALYDLRQVNLESAAAGFAEVSRLADALGASHPNYGSALNMVSQFQHRIGRLDESRRSMESAVASRQKVYGADDRSILEYRLARAIFDLREGRPIDAERGLTAIGDSLPGAFGSDHPLVDTLNLTQSRLLAANDDHRAAITGLEQLLLSHESAGRDVPVSVLRALAESHAALGSAQTALEFSIRALGSDRARFGSGSGATVASVVLAAELYSESDPAEARDLALEASRLGRAVVAAGDLWSAVSLSRNAVTLGSLGLADEAAADCRLIKPVLSAPSAASPAVADALARCN